MQRTYLFLRGSAGCFQAEIDCVVAASNAQGVPLGQVFFSSPSPGTLAVFFDDDFFHDHTQYVKALGRAMKTEYEAIHAAGLMLQVDCPDFAMGRHSKFKNKTISDFQAIVAVNIQVMDEALLNIPADRVRMHVCWGNYPGPMMRPLLILSTWSAPPSLSISVLRHVTLAMGTSGRFSGGSSSLWARC